LTLAFEFLSAARRLAAEAKLALVNSLPRQQALAGMVAGSA